MTAITINRQSRPPAERHERMARQARASKAENTWAAYGSDWRVWEGWAERNGVAALPAEPQHVASFLSDMSETRKLSTLKRYLASISVSHTMKGAPFDRKHAAIRTILRGISREKPDGVRRVKPIMATTVRAMLADMGDGMADLRDAALLALGVASGCRRSELAGLDWAERGDGQGVLALTDDGAAITLFRSKASQDEPATVYVQPGLALAAVRRWVEAAGISSGSPIFRPVGKGGRVSGARLSDRGIARIVKARAASAGLDPKDFSGHSLRAGMVTSAAEAGVPEWRIKLHSRHRSDCVKRYIRPVEQRKHSPTKEIGL
jgi:integrase